MSAVEKILAEYRTKGYAFTEVQEIRSGKEAVVYCVESEGKCYALKVYKDTEERAFQETNTYLEGKFYTRPSIRKAVLKGNRFAKKFLHTSWVKREFSLLKHLNTLGAAVPCVYDWTDSSILMEYLGDSEPAPRLIDIELTNEEAIRALTVIVETIKILFETGIVHADLSAYNILWWHGQPYLIDFPQAVDIRHNPNASKLLQRDLGNVASYFKNYSSIGVESLGELYRINEVSPQA